MNIICYVCEKFIKNKKDAVYIGSGRYRHTDCEPGTKTWMESRWVDESKYGIITECFEKGAEEEAKKAKKRKRQNENIE